MLPIAHLRPFVLTFTLLAAVITDLSAQARSPDPEVLIHRVFGMVERNTTFGLAYGTGHEPQEKIWLFDADVQTGGGTAETYSLGWTFATDHANLRIALSGYPAKMTLHIDGAAITEVQVTHGAPVRQDYSYSTFETHLPLPARYADGQVHRLELRDLRFAAGASRRQLYLGFLEPNGTSAPVAAEDSYQWRTPDTDWQPPAFAGLHGSGEPLDWSDFRYFTGALLAALRDAQDRYGEARYGEYVDRHHRFFFTHRTDVLADRDRYGHREGLFGHYARFRMLDDFGPQGVTIAESVAREGDGINDPRTDPAYQLVNAIADQLLTQVPRLDDGTLSRITPDSFTVQSDDLFMANLFSLRAGLALGREDLLNDALLQSVNFSTYLTDAETGLYRHAYSTKTGRQSSTIWGRGMGWTMMVDAMLLQLLDGRDDPRMEVIRESFVSRCMALLDYQGEDGRWHQVITDPTTYAETSATAMFTYALATGYRAGWLPDERVKRAALLGYAGMCSQIGKDGSVAGTVRGTPILPAPAAYANHAPRANDPRGIGAIIWAALAVDALD